MPIKCKRRPRFIKMRNAPKTYYGLPSARMTFIFCRDKRRYSALMKTLPMPHDSLFKKFFSDVGVVTDFLQIHLPPVLQEKCDFSTLKITSGSFVEADLGAQHADMLYSLQTTVGPEYLYPIDFEVQEGGK